MYNFKKFGIDDKAIVLIGYNPSLGVSKKALEFKNNTRAMVIFLPDNRALSDRLYTPSIRPHLIKQVYTRHPNLLENRAVLLHDCDIIFVKLPFVKDLITKRKIYVSDLSVFGEINIDPILLKEMCRVVGIPSSMVLKNGKGMGGAQYLFNTSLNFSKDFWDKVEQDANGLYKLLLVSGEKYGHDATAHAWSADMWAILWNIWLVGVDSEVSNELSFTIATSPISELDKNNIFHNTGVKNPNDKKLFNKRDFCITSPFEEELVIENNEYCSSFYVREIIEASQQYKRKK